MKTILFISFFICGIATLHAQMTHYGTASGTLGSGNSFFGYNSGNAAQSPSNNNSFFGHSSGQNITTGYNNTAAGFKALLSITTGFANCAYGSYALKSNTTGHFNIAIGGQSLYTNDSGDDNIAIGQDALLSNTNGNSNIAIGVYSLINNSLGSHNTGVGYKSLASNDYGDYNTAFGSHSLYSSTTGQMCTAGGYYALYSNTTGHLNTAIGGYSLSDNTSGSFNTATGYSALKKNNLGTYNTADGYLALNSNTTGSYNTASGTMALNKIASGSYNSGLGYRAGPATDALLENTTAIGYLAVPTASNQVRIGNTSVTSIGGEVEWTAFSDGRFKKDIKEDVSGLDFINELKPVSYTVDNVGLNKFLHVNDSSSNSSQAKIVPVRQTGFIAQEVEALVKKSGYVFSGVDAPENENDPYGIRYSEFVVPLVKAAQELSTQVQVLSAEVQEQREQIQMLMTRLDSKTDRHDAGYTSAALLQNSPNPFDAETVIHMTLPDNVGLASVMIYNLEGKQIKNILVSARGETTVKLSASELTPGMYLYSLIVDGKVVDTKRMVLTK